MPAGQLIPFPYIVPEDMGTRSLGLGGDNLPANVIIIVAFHTRINEINDFQTCCNNIEYCSDFESCEPKFGAVTLSDKLREVSCHYIAPT